jgi:hypothetical protein
MFIFFYFTIQERIQEQENNVVIPGFFLGLLVGPDNGACTFVLNIDEFLSEYKKLHNII